MKRISLVVIVLVLTNCGVALAATQAPTLAQYPELSRIVEFIYFIINCIRYGAGSIAGLIVTYTGWQVLTSDRGIKIAKENFAKALWAFFFIFGGTIIADFAVGKMVSIFLG
jgi:type III secretory pathway component EscS